MEGRFRTLGLFAVTPTRFYCPTTHRLLDFGDAPVLGAVLVRWREFASIGEMIGGLEPGIVSALGRVQMPDGLPPMPEALQAEARARITLEKALLELVRDGIAVSESSLLASAAKPDGAIPSTSTIAVLLAARRGPDRLRACINTLVMDASRAQREITLQVSDFSGVPGWANLNGTVLKECRDRYGCRITYYASDYYSDLQLALAKKGIPSEVCRLFATTAGYGWNPILCGALPGKLLIVEDDVAESAYGKGPRPLVLSGRYVPRTGRVPADEKCTEPSGRSLLTEHDRVLGRSLSDIVAEANEGRQLRGVCDQLLTSLRRRSGEIKVTTSGAVFTGPLKDAAEVESLVGNANHQLKARQVTGAGPLAICHRGPVLTPVLGLVTRDVFPPLPVMPQRFARGFSAAMSVCIDDSYIAHLPIAAQLCADSDRYAQDPGREDALDYVLAGCIAAVDQRGATTPISRISCLGRALMEVASLENGGLREHLTGILVRELAEDVSSDSAVDSNALPWPEIAAQIVDLQVAAGQISGSGPRRLTSDLADAAVLSGARQRIQEYGNLLSWWAALRETVSDLAREERFGAMEL